MRPRLSGAVFWMMALVAAVTLYWALAAPLAALSTEKAAAEAGIAAAADRARVLAAQLIRLRQTPLPDLSRFSSAGAEVTSEATTLQEQARQIAASSGGIVLGSQANQQDASDGAVKISILIQAQLSEPQLMAALTGLESGPKPFVVEAMTLDLMAGVSDSRNIHAVLTLTRLVTHAP